MVCLQVFYIDFGNAPVTLYHHVYVAKNLTFVRTIMFVFIVSTIVFGVLVLWSVRRRKLHVSIVCLVSLLQYVLRREDANLVFALLTFRMLVFLHPCVNTFVVYSTKTGADLGGGCRGCAPLPEMTCGFLIQLVFCKKKKQKKNYVVYWCWSRARDECTPS